MKNLDTMCHEKLVSWKKHNRCVMKNIWHEKIQKCCHEKLVSWKTLTCVMENLCVMRNLWWLQKSAMNNAMNDATKQKLCSGLDQAQGNYS